MAFEAILAAPDARPKRWLRGMLIASVAVHAAAIVVGIVHSMWTVEEMPMPSVQVTLMAAPPPPPPPPPPRSSTGSTKPKTSVKANTLVQPKEKPQDKKAEAEPEEADDDKGQEGGEQGGVVGGVQGGVVGGVVGSPAPPPPVDTGPKIVTAQVGRQQLAINPNVDPYMVTVPPALARSGQEYYAFVRMCVSAQGTVTSVQVVRPAGSPVIDPQIPTVLGRWRFRPLLLDGRPTPFCYPLRYEIK